MTARVTQVAEIAERIRDANASRTTLRITGRGGWLDAGRPVLGAETLSMAELTGVLDYTPGDLTLTARAGTSLGEIERVTAGERQWLALDPPGGSEGSIGATAATASAGPLAHAFGAPRDQLLGLEVVTGTGVRIATGGRVVKNVAGFDLTRLFTGSWGTLGVITEVTVRLRGVPEVDETVAVRVDDGAAAVDRLAITLRAMAIAPIALELLNAALARELSMAASTTLLARLAGNADMVRAQRAVLAALGDVAAAPPGVWGALGRYGSASGTVLRLSRAPSHVAALWSLAHSLGGAPRVHASLGRGIVRVLMPEPGTSISALHAARGATVIAERLPATTWAAWPHGARSALSVAVKQRYDPANVLNPGILGSDE